MVRTRFVAALLATMPIAACGVGDADTNTPVDSPKIDDVAEVQHALSAMPGASIAGSNADGTPHTLLGRLGTADRTLSGFALADVHHSISSAMPSIAAAFRLNADDLQVRRVSVDEKGTSHIRYGQTLNGLPVVGEEIVVHIDRDGNIFMANGSGRSGAAPSARPGIASQAATVAALRATKGTQLAVQGEPRLVYVRDLNDQQIKLAYEVRVVGQGEGMPLRNRVYVNAADASIAQNVPEIHTALVRQVYSANNQVVQPGTL
ncbi:peptidase M4, partial [Myxococcaceae bacterium JPH2]|nr:peptidase M4 [Myxococcaceae bacterium JPH2]